MRLVLQPFAMCLHAHDAALFYLTADPLKGFLKERHTAKSIFDWRSYIFFQVHMAGKLLHILLPGHHYEEANKFIKTFEAIPLLNI